MNNPAPSELQIAQVWAYFIGRFERAARGEIELDEYDLPWIPFVLNFLQSRKCPEE